MYYDSEIDEEFDEPEFPAEDDEDEELKDDDWYYEGGHWDE